MGGQDDVRRIAVDDAIPIALLRDFALTALRHDAIYDELIERMAFHAGRGQLDAIGLAAVLPELIGDVLEVVTKADWVAVAEALIADFREGIDQEGGEDR